MDPDTKRLFERPVMLVLLMPALLIIVFTTSANDMAYLNGIQGSIPILGPLIMLFVLFYATPAYIYIAVISKLASFIKIELFSEAVGDLEKAVSMPLVLLSAGFSAVYCTLRYVELDEEREGIGIVMANLAGLLIMLGFQFRLMYPVVTLLAALSFAFYLANLFLERMEKEE